jgi:NAD(P)-dependent dehydrogenase (short-subunit alcohol dehydrogenase family)
MGASTNQVAIVTGGGGVIGRGIVRRLHEAGASVAIVGQNADKLTATYDAVGIPEPERLAITGDVATEELNIEMVRATVEQFGRLDTIVTSVYWSKGGKSQDISLAEWDRSLGVTLTSTFLAAKHGVPAILETAGRGNIVAISSVHGDRPGSDYAMYAAAKGGLNQLVRALAYDHTPQGIRVNGVSPGATGAEEHETDPLGGTGVDSLYLTGHWVTADDIGDAVAFLVSDRARSITGQILTVDGGCSIPEHNWLMATNERRWKEKSGME